MTIWSEHHQNGGKDDAGWYGSRLRGGGRDHARKVGEGQGKGTISLNRSLSYGEKSSQDTTIFEKVRKTSEETPEGGRLYRGTVIRREKQKMT